MKDWVQKFLRGGISRREFVERAAAGGLSLFATASILRGEAHAEAHAVRADHHHDHGHDNSHDHHHHEQQGRVAAQTNRKWDQTNVNPWEQWLKQENLPVYKDYYIADLRAAEVKPWKRLGAGASGAYIDLVGGEGVNVGYLCEIAPGAKTEPQRYLFEEVMYVLSGEGESLIWNPGSRTKQTVKWKAGSVLAPPLNVWRQHVNRGSRPARFLVMTNAPVVIDLFHNLDFVFNNDYAFRDRYNGEPDFFGVADKVHHKDTTSTESEQANGVDTWDGGFVPDARELALRESKERGEGNYRIELQLADNTMQAHISEFETGTYKKAHRHGPGSHVVMLNGRGYTLMWKGSLKYSDAPQQTQKRVDWVEGSLFVPPDGWFHQHFNTGPDPARYLAPTWGGDGKWFMRALGGGGRTHRLGKTSTRKGGNLIEYDDEDPAIREIYVAELKKNGIEFRMRSRKGKAS